MYISVRKLFLKLFHSMICGKIPLTKSDFTLVNVRWVADIEFSHNLTGPVLQKSKISPNELTAIAAHQAGIKIYYVYIYIFTYVYVST